MILIFIIGLCLGSFLNVLVYRLPLAKSIAKGRSRCPNCSSQLRWFELIPVLSFIVLAGKCRTCKNQISLRYPLIELVTGLLFYHVWASFIINPLLAIFWIGILFFLWALFLFDLGHYILPNVLLLAMTVFVVGYRLVIKYFGYESFLVSWREAIIAGIVISVLLGIVWFFSRGRWLGFGDVKYGFVIGLVFGATGGFIILYGAVILGGIVALILLISRRAGLKTKLPLGAFISVSAAIYVFHQTILNHFFRQLFL